MASAQQLANLQSVVPAAVDCARKYGVFASVTLAQWILESAWGLSKLATSCHNYFGVKWTQRSTPATYEEFPTYEFIAGKRTLVKAAFASYASADEAFTDHAKLLSSTQRYAAAMKAKTPAAFATALEAAGYSTNPDYAESLQELIRRYNLTQYDVPPATAAASTAA
ncbi:glycoside hydrolase family 73 protein [Granulicella cerasi]|uniref:Glycoside hydrolase family 73 protein n=1 Tax=Granulicella cerasi TaxID=741063 RepID=A0ABW1Z995_9BACT|nr:glucosaminidase domain-containing protein [Granulicella cerasi]